MNFNIIKYCTPTLLEAERIEKIVFLLLELQANEGDPALYTGKFEQEKPLVRVGLWGNPDVEVHFVIGTRNRIVADMDETWERAAKLYFTVPWPFSLWWAWIIFIRNAATNRRTMKREG